MNKQAQKQLSCSNCHKLFTPVETFVDSEQNLCPACQEMQAQKRGSGRDEGQSHLQYGRCEYCGSQTQYLPHHKGHQLLCPDCENLYSSSSY